MASVVIIPMPTTMAPRRVYLRGVRGALGWRVADRLAEVGARWRQADAARTEAAARFLALQSRVLAEVDSAAADHIDIVRNNIVTHAPDADIVLAESAILVASPEQIKGKRVLVVEDGPTLTHGDMAFGAGTIAARRYGAAELVEAARYAVGSLRDTYARYPHIRQVLPAMGYGPRQVRDLEATIRAAECDLVLCATPIDLPK